MPKFVISVPVKFSLEKVVEAKDENEALKIAEELEATEFDNFHFFYEWLGDNWRELKNNIKIERLS